MEVINAHASATLALQGGHIMSWQPKSETEPVVWLSRAANFTPGKSIRGGVPVCWPWFGTHATDPKRPTHGFARTVPWEVTATRALDNGATEIALTLVETDQTRTMWPHRTKLSITITVGPRLKIALATDNLGNEDAVIGEALHAYFHIGDIADIRIGGLEGCDYLDKVGGGNVHRRQDGPVVFSAETDRIYSNTDAECVIEDPRLKRRIHVAKSGSYSTVVWNPWTEKANKMGDFGPDGWRGMVCVESANAAENVVTIRKGSRHTLAVEYWTEKYSG
ncbi:MAG: D-hexose-6-phosphate mutarotase [Sulfuricaulis sp.]|uniref:D-hexose-6-phosphate mutarotase n=1 Tax=Sulfuricaulis sp. TaxID=2003553 RepID=UPI0025DAB962|nr:D-hexose-6-phosphate mutarotase [Sulfuricaulis sp.]MCR4347570.1 D-hexose-6-phosphate mutarotase [Sulfuricaulis sp.]